MKNSNILSINFGGKAIAKNSILNLIGYIIPSLVAIMLIPIIVRELGEERFGILTLSWIIIGYAGFLDFGIGRGLTKIVSEKIGRNQIDSIPEVFWSSMFLMLIITIAASIIVILLIPELINIFKISTHLITETQNSFYLLALSIPIVATTASLRGFLEAYQKFGIINILRVVLGISTFILPIFILLFTNNLFWIVFSLAATRAILWFLYLFQCIEVNKSLKNKISFNFNAIKPILKFSIWISIANIINPIILYSDRFLIASLINASALTYYSTPYEVITKLVFIPWAITGVLFPIFSASYNTESNVSKKIFIRGAKFIFLFLYPIIFLVVTFSYEGMQIWLNEKFAIHSSFVLKCLAVGVLFNSLATVPDNFFQGIGKPKISTIVYLIELPIFILGMLIAIISWGISGVAFVWMISAIASSTTLFIIAKVKYDINIRFPINITPITLMLSLLAISFIITGLYIKIIFSILVICSFFIFSWKYFLAPEEKKFFLSKLNLQ